MMVLELPETAVPVEIKSVFFKFLASNMLLFCYLDLNGRIKEKI